MIKATSIAGGAGAGSAQESSYSSNRLGRGTGKGKGLSDSEDEHEEAKQQSHHESPEKNTDSVGMTAEANPPSAQTGGGAGGEDAEMEEASSLA